MNLFNVSRLRRVSLFAVAAFAAGSSDTFAAWPDPSSANVVQNLKPLKERPAVKMKNGWIVLFPELAKPFSPIDFAVLGKQMESVKSGLKELESLPEVPLSNGMERIRSERFQENVKLLIAALQVLDSGSWDVSFLVQMNADVQELAVAAKDIKILNPKRVKILTIRLQIAYYLETIVEQRVKVAASLRMQQLHQVRAARYRCELDLAEAEDAAAKAP